MFDDDHKAPIDTRILHAVTPSLVLRATGAAHGVPRHGGPMTMEHARADTRDDQMHLRAQRETDGDVMDAPQIDQQAVSQVERFESLARRSAPTAFQRMARE